MTVRAVATFSTRAFIRCGSLSPAFLSRKAVLERRFSHRCSNPTTGCLASDRHRNVLSCRALLPFSRHYSSIPNKRKEKKDPPVHEDIYTLPNALTLSRILACPVLGWSILEGNFTLATGLLAYAGITDWVSISSVFGTVSDWMHRWTVFLPGDTGCGPSWEPSLILQRTRYS